MTPTPTETAELANASNSLVGGTASAYGLGPIFLFTIYTGLIIAAVGFATNNYHRYEQLARLVETLAGTFEYFIKGVGATALLIVTFYPIYAVSQTSAETRGMVGYAIAAAILGYVAITTIGYIADRLYQRAREQHHEYRAPEPAVTEVEGDAD